jgi:two-component system, OmpR family, response regulator CpxR
MGPHPSRRRDTFSQRERKTPGRHPEFFVCIAKPRSWIVTMATELTPDAPTKARVTILLIDDDIELCELMRRYFVRRDVDLEVAHDGRRGLARALAGGHDLLLLDVMMPGLDGFEVLRQVRRQRSLPVIMLTARTAESDRITGLDAGADDYLPKPFGPDELLARIRAVLRRTSRPQRNEEAIEVGVIKLIPGARKVLCEGFPVTVTTVEYDLLEFLIRAAGRIVSRNELTSVLYHRQPSRFDRVLDMHVSNLRKKLGRHGTLIRTVRGVGYLFGTGLEPGEEP